MSNIQEHFKRMLENIEAERAHEEKFYDELQAKKSLQQRIDAGVLWHPALITKINYTLGELIEIQLEKVKHLDTSHKFKSGAGVRIFTGKDESFEYLGNVSYVRNRKMSIILSSKTISKSSLLHLKYISVELRYDERPFKVMRETVKQVLESKAPFVKELQQSIALNRSVENPINQVSIKETPVFLKLNQTQKKAISFSLERDHLAIIHGPPGTGKTTSLIALIEQLCIQQKKILVCAPSNNAVDLLAKLTDQLGIDVVRTGNVTRIADDLGHVTLAEKARSHKDWQHIKKVRIEAEEARRQADKFKRSFGRDERAERKMMRKESRALLDWAKELEARLIDDIMSKAQVVACTLIGAAHYSLKEYTFDVVIIDEGSQALEPECWVPILKAPKLIIAGDHKQLPPTVLSEKARKNEFNVTLLDRLSKHTELSHLLNIQYRMHPDILAFSNHMFYDAALITDATVLDRKVKLSDQPLVLIDTAGSGFEETMNKQHHSYYNEGEYFIIQEYLIQSKERLLGSQIGIIAPYAQQVRHIQAKLKEASELKGLDIEVNSIDGFQGQEKDMIIISLVRSNPDGNIGFVSDARRLNVAMTRAKKSLIIIGDSATLCQHSLYNELYNHIEKYGDIQSAWSYMSY